MYFHQTVGGHATMPLYQASKDRKDEGLKIVDVLGLESTMKGVEILDLKVMIEEMESIDVPSVFICPISLEPMQDPVTLCTGQTYDRSNILKWFSLGHKTCPTTMQELWDDSVTPNKTLTHLILTWFSHKYLAMKKKLEDVQGRVLDLLDMLKKVKGQARVKALKDLRQLVAANVFARRTVSENGGLALVCSLLGPFTSHAVGSEAIGIIVNLDLVSELKRNLMHPAKVSLLVDIMNEGTIETKMNCAKLIEMLLIEGSGNGNETEIVSSLSLLVGLLRLVRDKKHPTGVLTGLILLKAICSSHESVRSSVISIGAVPQLIELLPSLNKECLEVALYILEVLSTLPEGRMALKECPNIIPNVVKLLMRVSERCTQFALSILWAIYKLAPEECASKAVEAGLAAKLLLVIQSGCNPVLKQMSSEFLKMCSVNYSTSILISKCMLSTIQ
ncbi:U-box domain-containing protein 30-like isoform X2 [Lotus japonicus]|uniref:U-box domain-containing protein 30-like isoform X2 n=1 Tax=Lotus japonicus TaxID=34305 RepID=UPI00258C6CF6|nr:U-box domain-containing protein 30-like isoform X2 [Lotus japonicus]